MTPLVSFIDNRKSPSRIMAKNKNNTDDILSKRAQFLSLLDKDIEKNEKIREEFEKDVKSIEVTRQYVKELGKVPEHQALISLCKNLYMPATIVHTGEYMVKKKAYPNSYFILKTLDQTFKDLDERIKDQRKLLERAEQAIPQLKERKKMLLGEIDNDSFYEQQLDDDDEYRVSKEVQTMPKEIKSDKGVAVKVGGFYEIFEYEDD